MKRALVLYSTSALAAVAALPAFAQTTAPAASNGPSAQLEEIVVTAQRRSENLQRAAIPVAAVSGDALQAASISTAANITKLVPALIVQPSGGGSNVNFYLRGVGTVGTNSFSENAISFNVDGVYVARPAGATGVFYDVDRLEVLRGPQGTLYGRNSTGGAVNVITNKPQFDRLGGDVSVEVGNYDSVKTAAALNVPVNDHLAVRLAGQVVSHSGYLSDGYDDEKGQAFRGQVLYQPNSDLSLRVEADYAHQGGKGTGAVLYPYVDSSDPWLGGATAQAVAALKTRVPLAAAGLVSVPATGGFVNSDYIGVAATADIRLPFGTLTVIPAYRNDRTNYLSYVPGFYGRVDERAQQESIEARVTSDNDQRLRYVAGLFYFHQKVLGFNEFNLGRLSDAVFFPELTTDSVAVFGQATYDVTQTFRLVGGLRYTQEKKSQDTPFFTRSLAQANPPFAYAIGKRTDDATTWKGGVEWDAGPQSLVYANVSTGFKAGGFFQSTGVNSFAPEKLTAYTVGAKNRFFDNRLQFNVELFYWEYKNQQINFIGGIQSAPGVFAQGSLTQNIGRSRMYGVEPEILFKPTRSDLFTADIQFLDAKYQDFKYTTLSSTGAAPAVGCSAVRNTTTPIVSGGVLYDVDCSGFPAVNAPKWTVNLGYDHTFDLGDDTLVLGLRAQFQTARYLKPEFLEGERQGAYGIGDAFLTYKPAGAKWTATAFVNNITNEAVFSTVTNKPIANVLYAGLRPPRTFGARLNLSF